MGSRLLWDRDASHRQRKALSASSSGKGTMQGTGHSVTGAEQGSVGVRGKVTTSGFHHVALVTKDIKKSIQFYEEALGMKLRCMIPMHGFPGSRHCFLEAGNGAEISFVQFAEPRDGVPGVTYPENPQDDVPVRAMHHMAYKCNSVEQLIALRRQIMQAGTMVSPIIDHNFCCSAYFDDPNGFHIELTYTYRPYEQRDMWPELLDRKPTHNEEHAAPVLVSSKQARAIVESHRKLRAKL